MYMHGPGTEEVLASCGIRVCSDGVRAVSRGPEWHEGGLFNLPINVIPDHEHLYHAERTRDWVAAWQRRYKFADDFGYDLDEEGQPLGDEAGTTSRAEEGIREVEDEAHAAEQAEAEESVTA